MGERERERENASSPVNGSSISGTSPSPEAKAAQRHLDRLFDRLSEKSEWEPIRSPEVLGELLDSRHMLPLILPSDPRFLSAVAVKVQDADASKRSSFMNGLDAIRGASQASFGIRGAMAWRSQSRKLRDVGVSTLRCIDGARSLARWHRLVQFDTQEEEEEKPPPPPYSSTDPNPALGDMQPGAMEHFTPLTRKPSSRSRGRASMGEDMDGLSDNLSPSSDAGQV